VSTSLNEQTRIIKPYLFLGGISFLIYFVLTFQIMIYGLVSPNPIPFIERIFQSIAYLIGIISIIILMFQIRSIYYVKRKNINVSIILLSLYLAFEIFFMFIQVESIIRLWISILLVLAFCFLRLIAFLMTNTTLKIPSPEYGSRIFVVFGWSFLITAILFFILTLSGILSFRPELISAAIIILLIQSFIDIYCILAFGVAFVCHAICNPRIKQQIYTQTIIPTKLSDHFQQEPT